MGGVQGRWGIQGKKTSKQEKTRKSQDEGGGAGGSRSRGVWGGPRGGGGVQAGPRAENTKKEKRSTTVWLATMQQHPGFCAGGSSRPNGSGYPLSVLAVAC